MQFTAFRVESRDVEIMIIGKFRKQVPLIADVTAPNGYRRQLPMGIVANVTYKPRFEWSTKSDAKNAAIFGSSILAALDELELVRQLSD